MKAITLWQPWASLVLIGAKPYEFRSWLPPRNLRGKRIAIHAGARPVRRAEVADLLNRLEANDPLDTPCLYREPALALLRRVWEGFAVKMAVPLLETGEPERPFRLPLSCIVCTAILGEPKRGDACAKEFGRAGNDSDRHEHFNWGWPLTDIDPVMPPIEARGAQGFWDWHDSAYAAAGSDAATHRAPSSAQTRHPITASPE
jgi:hypothetical protein